MPTRSPAPESTPMPCTAKVTALTTAAQTTLRAKNRSPSRNVYRAADSGARQANQRSTPTSNALGQGNRFLQGARQLRRIAEPLERRLQRCPQVSTTPQFFLINARQVGKQLLTHTVLATVAYLNRPHGTLNLDHEFLHSGAPRIPPTTLTNCRHSARPSFSRRVPFLVR